MKIYFLRHGIAAARGEWKGDDASRPLTDDGRKAMKREAKALRKLGVDPDLIITSPLTRAKETAEILADRLGMKIVEDERLASGFDAAHLSSILREHEEPRSVVLVGHEPDFSKTISQLIGGARIDVKKGGVACVNLEHSASLDGELVWLAPPSTLT